jgi:MFS family permease
MSGFTALLRENRNYRRIWVGQVISEVGDHFNNIAVLALAFQYANPGLVVTGIMLARAMPMLLAGPFAGVVLDRFDRKRIMISSDLVRAVIAVAFILTASGHRAWLMYLLSALLMLASPFFTAGRSAILPRIASARQLHSANAVTQTTAWTTTMIGSLAGGTAAAAFGYEWAFVLNSLSFLFSAWAVAGLRAPGGGGFRVVRSETVGQSSRQEGLRPFHDYVEGLRYMKSHPLILALALVNFGWATGGGAAQVLFPLFGEQVFHKGAPGIGLLYTAAGLGLILGGTLGHRIGPALSFRAYRWTISICYVVHGASYILFSLMPTLALAMVFLGFSRAAVAVSSVLNFSQLLRTVSDEFRGRVFSTLETITWTTMLVSTMAAGIATGHAGPRTIGIWSGAVSSLTAVYWAWAHRRGRLRQAPAVVAVEMAGDR